MIGKSFKGEYDLIENDSAPLALVLRGEGTGVRGFSSVIQSAVQNRRFLGIYELTSIIDRTPHPQPLVS